MILLMQRLFVTLVLVVSVLGLATNRTIDDQLGDSVTGNPPAYLPHDIWTQGSQCVSCYAKPDPAQVFDHTWHDGTILNNDPKYDELNITMEFTGTAVYAYCILINTNNVSWPRITNLTFSLDGAPVGTFLHGDDGLDMYEYNQLVYANTSLSNNDHVFIIHMPKGINTTAILFDYVQYTYESDATPEPSASSPNPIPSHTTVASSRKVLKYIVGGVVAGVTAPLLIVGIILLCQRYRRRHRGVTVDIPPMESTTNWNLIGSDLHVQALDPTIMYASPQYTTAQRTTGTPPPTQVDSYPDSPLTSDFSVSSSQGGLMHRLEGYEQKSVSLPGTSSIGGTSSSVSPPASPNQVEELRKEVERLRQMLVASGTMPPQYEG